MSWDEWAGSKPALARKVEDYAASIGKPYSEVLLALLHESIVDVQALDAEVGFLLGMIMDPARELRDESSFLRECIVSNARDANAENERLCKERDFYFQQVTDNGERAHEAIDALNAENAKLRELVRDLYKDLAAILGDGLWMEPYESEMMELGVDV